MTLVLLLQIALLFGMAMTTPRRSKQTNEQINKKTSLENCFLKFSYWRKMYEKTGQIPLRTS